MEDPKVFSGGAGSSVRRVPRTAGAGAGALSLDEARVRAIGDIIAALVAAVREGRSPNVSAAKHEVRGGRLGRPARVPRRLGVDQWRLIL